MDIVDLQLRPAQPGDVDQVVPLMHDSSRSLIDATFGRDATAVLRRDFLRGKGLFGYRHQMVAVTPDGAIAATITAYEGRRYRRLSLHTLCSATRLGPASLIRAVRRTLAMSALFTPPRPDGLFLANLCVADRHRGKGIGSMLLRHAARSARGRGLRTVEFDVSYSNPRAQRLYERLGYVVTGEKPAGGNINGSGLDGFRRMEGPI
jgi:ribosomal protein S18 acetylase RimI-like enzyme